MKRYLLVLINVVFLFSFLFAQTDVNPANGRIDGEIWSKAGSPYYILKDLIIEDLLILDGVTVLFTDDFKFEVSGTLKAKGFYSDSIYFKAEPSNPNGWQGISFTSDNVNSELQYCRIEGANDQGVAVEQSSVTIANCDMVNNNGDGMLISNIWGLEINNCVFANNKKNGVSVSTSVVKFTNVIISGNEQTGLSSLTADNAINLTNVVIADNQQSGVEASGGNNSFTNTIIYFNSPDLSLGNATNTVSYSDIGGGSVFPGTGNLNVDPQFADRTRYPLSEQSSLVDAGKANDDEYFPPSLGGSRTDMGAYGGPGAGLWYPSLYITPDTLDFGKVTQDSSRSHIITVYNYRDEDILVESVSFIGADAGVFSADKTGFRLVAGDSTEITLTFRPTDRRVFQSQLQLTTSSHGAFSTHVVGQGAIPIIDVSDSWFDFDTVYVGESSFRKLIISNSGDDTLRIKQITTGSSVFIPMDSLLKIVPYNGIDTVEIAFVPDSLENYQDTLVIESNDPQKPELDVGLSGTGIGAVVKLEQDTVDFQTVKFGSDSTISLIIGNIGNSRLEISRLEIVPLVYTKNAFRFKDENITFPLFIEPAAEYELLVAFQPDSAGIDSAILVLTSNDPFDSSKKVMLIGSGVGPILYIPYSEIDFGNVPIFTESRQQIFIRNSGNKTLIIDSLLINHTSQQDEMFEFVNPSWLLPFPIQPDSSYTVTIGYSPTKSNADSAQFIIYSNDPVRPQKIIKLSGNSEKPQIEVDRSAIDFGHLADNSEAVQSVLVYNRGGGDLLIYRDSLSISGTEADAFKFDSLTSDLHIIPGDSAEIIVHAFSGNLGPKNAQLHISNNDPSHRQLIIPLTVLIYESEVADIRFESGHSTTQFIKGKDGILSFSIVSQSKVDSAALFIRFSGEQTFSKIQLNKQDNTDIWSAQIESQWITERGFEYYMSAYYGWTSTIWPENGIEQPKSIQVAVPSLTFPQKTKKEIYQKISLPLFTYGQTLSDLFEDNLGKYDTKKYRFFDCLDGKTYTELTDMSSELPPGKAVWLITREPITLDVANGLSLPTDQPYSISLKKGWNMIGNPYSFPVAWADVDSVHSLRYYDGIDWLFVSVLEPYKGYAVYVERDTVVKFISKEVSNLYNLPKSDFVIKGEKWHIQLALKADSFKDVYNFAGAHPQATSKKDRYDYLEPPPIGSFVSLYFLNEEKERFSTHYEEPDKEGYIFPFEVAGNVNKDMTLFVYPQNLPEDYSWLVLSSATGLKFADTVIPCGNKNRDYQLVVGTKSFLEEISKSYAEIPADFNLSQNYPNPFNPRTTITFHLPVAANISLHVFNVLGQRIKTIIDNQRFQPGYYSVQWDGNNDSGRKASNGVYFLQLRSNHFQKTLKMVMQK